MYWAVLVTGAVLFFFSSRRRHTRCSRDWSSDVCSSDLFLRGSLRAGKARAWHALSADRARGLFARAIFEPTSAGGVICCSLVSLPREIGRASCRERV